VTPEVFGRYELLERVAIGGMGEVFLARHQTLAGVSRFVAVKRMLDVLSSDEHAVQMFLDEARLASRLDHQNVVRIFDLGLADHRYYLAMEFLEGRDMRRIMGRLARYQWPLPFAFAAKIAADAAKGLHYAHELTDEDGASLNVIHRDISPQNIFVTVQGAIKVVDFGIAKARSRMAKTLDGMMKGKVAYVSSERIFGQPFDRRADVFSLGVVLWELSIGRRLFRRDNDVKTMMAIVSSDVPLPTAMNPDYPPELEAIVMRALAHEQTHRYQTCRELGDDLNDFMTAAGYVVTPQRLGEWVKTLFENEPITIEELSAHGRWG